VDVVYSSWREAQDKRVCRRCSQWSYKMIGTRNFIHPSLSSLYDREEPALGYEKFGSYENKRRLLRRWNAEEGSDPVKGSRQYRPEIPDPRTEGSSLRWGEDTRTLQ